MDREQEQPIAGRKWFFIVSTAAVLAAGIGIGVAAGYSISAGRTTGMVVLLACPPILLLAAYGLYRKVIFPSIRRLEDANLELHLKQEELLDTKDDLFIKFLGIYDVNYAVNSPRRFADRLNDVADVTARAMEAEVCLIFLYDKKRDSLTLAASNGSFQAAIGKVRIPLGEGIEGWVGRRLEPLLLTDVVKDKRYRETGELSLAGYASAYTLPLYVYSNASLEGVIEVLYEKPKRFSDEEINFFTTLAGIISTTVQNEELQVELQKMNLELEQWITEKTEELGASEERYRTLVENATESIFVLAGNGDILFVNEQGSRLTGLGKYELVHKNLFELLIGPGEPSEILALAGKGEQPSRQAELRKSDGANVPVEVSFVGLGLMGKHFVQAVIRDLSGMRRLEMLLEEKNRELMNLRRESRGSA